jgi:DNA-binding CsgD family transcriptional regulator
MAAGDGGYDEPVTFVDRVPRPPRIPIPDLAYSPDDPAALYPRRLTHLEICVVNLLADGYNSRMVAIKRRIPHHYVCELVRRVCRKLQISSKYALVDAWRCEIFHEGMLALGLVPYPTKPQR